jgi:hypothetical protein
MNTTQWGRKETIVRPPHAPVFAFAATFAALILTCVFIGLYIGFLMSPLQRWYLPLYARTGVVGIVHKVDTYQLLYVADVHLHARPAIEADVEKGSTPQPNRQPLPLAPLGFGAYLRPGLPVSRPQSQLPQRATP